MRSTKAPVGDLPLGQKSDSARGNPNSGGGPAAAAAKVSLCLGLFGFLLNYYAATNKVELSPRTRLTVLVIVAAMILTGLALAVVATAAYRRAKRPGVIGFAVAALLVNGMLIAGLVYAIVRA